MTNPFDELLAIVQSAMEADQPTTPRQLLEHDIAQRIAFIRSELDSLIALSRDNAPDIQKAICAEEQAFGSILARVQLICSFIDAQRPQGLRLVGRTRR